MTSAAPLQRLAARTTSRPRAAVARRRRARGSRAGTGARARCRRVRASARGASRGRRFRLRLALGSQLLERVRVGSSRGRPSRAWRGSGPGGSRRDRSPRPARSSSTTSPAGSSPILPTSSTSAPAAAAAAPTPTAGPAASCFEPRNRRCGLPTTTITPVSLPHSPSKSRSRPHCDRLSMSRRTGAQTCVRIPPVTGTASRRGAATGVSEGAAFAANRWTGSAMIRHAVANPTKGPTSSWTPTTPCSMEPA